MTNKQRAEEMIRGYLGPEMPFSVEIYFLCHITQALDEAYASGQKDALKQSYTLEEVIDAVNKLPAYWVEENLISNLKNTVKKRE